MEMMFYTSIAGKKLQNIDTVSIYLASEYRESYLNLYLFDNSFSFHWYLETMGNNTTDLDVHMDKTTITVNIMLMMFSAVAITSL